MLEIFISIILLSTLSVFLVKALLISPAQELKAHTDIQLRKTIQKSNFLEKIIPQLTIANTTIAPEHLPLLVVFSLAISSSSCLIFAPWLCTYKYGFSLGLIMSTAYILRAYFHFSSLFRSNLLLHLERIFSSIRNQLSTGSTLDYALRKTAKQIKDGPLSKALSRFLKIHESNLIEGFPKWLRSIEEQFKIKELAEISQLLRLELTHNNNQEEAFVNAAKAVNQRRSANEKQKNILNITFITLDFMILAFLAMIIFIIPDLSSEWWESQLRPGVIFQTSSMIWGAYALSIAIAMRRQK